MGVVYVARDTRLDRPVAIKAVPEHLATDPDRLARFQREAKVLASLNHPNIAAIHGLEDADRRPYLILEYVEGETLTDRLARGAIPVDETLPIGRGSEHPPGRDAADGPARAALVPRAGQEPAFPGHRRRTHRARTSHP
jgi:serine/threonine protein kinase